MVLTMYARLVEGSGLVECLNNAKMTQTGAGTALISVSNNVSRSKYILQVITNDSSTSLLRIFAERHIIVFVSISGESVFISKIIESILLH